MDRHPVKRPVQQQPAQSQSQGSTRETFSEMASATASSKGLAGKLLVISLIIVSIAVTAFVGFAIISGFGGQNVVKGDQYQAVFLSDGQIYFGKLSDIDQEYAVLEDIYYLQVEQQVQPVTEDEQQEDQPRISLAKLGSELHGPEDKMLINSDQILFWENLKDEGQVTQAINDYQANGGNENQQNVEQQEAPQEEQ